MFYLPVSPLLFFILLLSLPFLIVALTFDIVTVSAAKLGFAPGVALLLLILIFIGGALNIPLYRTQSIAVNPSTRRLHDGWGQPYWGLPNRQIRQSSVVALNVGGGLIPILIALYQFTQAPFLTIVAVTALVTTVSYYASQVVPGIGIQINPLLPPLTAAIAASLLTPHAAPVAFAGGVLGTLIGADLLHLPQLNSPGIMSIGGAGVFDGIALCGLFSLLLS